MHFGYELFVSILKLLKWIEEKLPDKPRLGLLLLAIGAAIITATLMLSSVEILGLDSVDPTPVWFFLGGACAVLGSYIFFRRAVWMWQDKRAPRVTTLRLK